ncbi:hypothetical protein FHP25_05440 [Vineibacter terrae]|uniref:Uncharacterized protein n=1 Tax=Vineibacter terrae TaxID=2586908 RepID=A0A5C8PTQ8_9HYPH|nr:hypothetical protein [Vineibacter terrae]TXL80469.1 hypothetical protein FHP25_05440 [Vineibacter terrae]
MRLALGPLAPDNPDLGNAGLEDAVNCLPLSGGYGPLPDARAFSSSLSSTCMGAYATRDVSGVVSTFAATAGQLYKASATGWTNVSRTASYTTANDGRWDFATFGNTCLAANGVDAMQVYTLGSSSRFLDQSASASAPVASLVTVVRDFVFAGRLATQINAVQWCQINNPLRFTSSARLQSDRQELPGEGGAIVAMTGGDFATILAQRSIWRGTYVGAPVIFRFDEVVPNIGCFARGSAARFQNMTFFLSQSGFYLFDGAQAVPIGDGMIDGFFKADLNPAFRHRITSVIDPINKLYVVSYPSNASSDGTPDRAMLYNWAARRWARAEITVELIFAGLSAGMTLEQLDSIAGSLDALPFSLDSDLWAGGLTVVSGFDIGHRLVTFDGPPRAARFITGESQLVLDRRAFMTAVRPLVQGTAATAVSVQVGKRDRLIDPVMYTAASAMNANGTCPVRANARFHRLRLDISGGYSQALGFDVQAVPEGMR